MRPLTSPLRIFRPLQLVLLSLLPALVTTAEPAQTPPSLFTAAPGFAPTDRYVATSVFHWYTPTAGQQTGPWRPVGGRENWTGEPEWWKGQIKQMMSANIDVLYVHLLTSFESQRINLFQALNQLRAEGYDTPQVAPFLDPMIIWNQQPLVDLATTTGKDEFVRHYIRFFEQYFAASTGAFADDYLARQDDKPILNTWHPHLTTANMGSLTRADVVNRLSAAFAAEHPFFANGIVMVTTALNPTLSFADEKVPQFEINEYYYAATFNGIQSVQLKGGYWDQNIRNPGDFLARAGGAPYRDAWNQVDRSTTRRVYIESWNEYDEGTGIYAAQDAPYIAPANTSGHTDEWSTTDDPFEYIKTTAAGAAAFNDVAERDAAILWHNIPATLAPGETRTATVIVRNTGDTSWTAAAGYRLEQIDAGTAFVANKRVPLNDSADEIPTYGGIFRGRPKAFQLTLTVPNITGNHTTRWRMAQEGGAAFGEELTASIEIKAKVAATVSLSGLGQMADGTFRTVTATTTPAGLGVDVLYDGSPVPPTAPGSYAVAAHIDHADYHGSATGTLTVVADPNLLAATGGFEDDAVGETMTSPPDVVDSTTFTGWRAFNVVSANVAFTATITDEASVGGRAMRLAVNNTTPASNFALDQWAPDMQTPVELATDYRVSFDAAWVAGAAANNLLFQVQEFDSTGNFLGNGLSELRSVATGDYETHTFAYRPANAATAAVGLFFSPMRGVAGTTTVHIDNVQLIDVTNAPPPVLAAHPVSQNVTAGGAVTLTAEAIGVGPFTYQWFHDGVAISGATAATHVLSSAQEFQAGSYTVRVANATGDVTSSAANLSVAAAASNTGRLLNLSTRAQTLTGDNILIPGFVVSGTGTKRLLIRAVGPTLAQSPYNVAGTLSNPRMALKRLDFAQTPPAYVDVAENDDWEDNPNATEISDAIDALFAFPFGDERESALLLDLAPGQYTVFADGVNAATGIAIVELYDADGSSPTTRLANISNRGFVGTGDAVMIPGFVVSSEGPKTLLVRVVGPTLARAPYNVPGTMADPRLQLFRTEANGSNTLLLTQDNWNDNPDEANTRQTADDLDAFALDEDSTDAAFVVTLQPGTYTVVGSSADGTSTGVVLVEVYVVP